LRPCITSRKVAGSIPEGVTGDFHLLSSFGSTTAMGSTQPLAEMSNRNVPGGKGGQGVGLTTLQLSCADCLEICEPQPPGNGTLQACRRIDLPLYLLQSSALLSQKLAVLYGPEPTVLLVSNPQLMVNTGRNMRT